MMSTSTSSDAAASLLLVSASTSGDAAAVAELLQRDDVRTDYKARGEDRTPLGIAAFGGHADVVRLFLDAGADVLKTGDDYCTPLHCALLRGPRPGLKSKTGRVVAATFVG